MPGPLRPDYFSVPPFLPSGPELWSRYTCTVCGLRSKTWESFKAHRAGPECFPAPHAGHAEGDGPAWQRGETGKLDRDAMEALRALASQLPDPDPIDTAQWAEETLD